MIQLDSSAWIEYYRRGGSKEVRDAVFAAVRDNRAASRLRYQSVHAALGP